MAADRYVWFIWASAFWVAWLFLFVGAGRHRRAMIWASLFTTPFGLTEPLFVPAYWNPPSLFGLAQRTRFDLESLIFCFAIGGIGAVLYNVLTAQLVYPVPPGERHRSLHRYHYLALASPFVVFAILYFFPWNPIYPGIVAMAVGAVATMLCRPDLRAKTWIGGLVFLTFYVVFLVGLELTVPSYIERVWNLRALSGIAPLGLPAEELLFAFGFGMYWSGVYEHFTWRKAGPAKREVGSVGKKQSSTGAPTVQPPCSGG